MFKGVLAFAIFSGAVWAQSDTASLSGTVTDPSGSGVVDAEVTLPGDWPFAPGQDRTPVPAKISLDICSATL
jgi:hypothetical protein